MRELGEYYYIHKRVVLSRSQKLFLGFCSFFACSSRLMSYEKHVKWLFLAFLFLLTFDPPKGSKMTFFAKVNLDDSFCATMVGRSGAVIRTLFCRHPRYLLLVKKDFRNFHPPRRKWLFCDFRWRFLKFLMTFNAHFRYEGVGVARPHLYTKSRFRQSTLGWDMISVSTVPPLAGNMVTASFFCVC